MWLLLCKYDDTIYRLINICKCWWVRRIFVYSSNDAWIDDDYIRFAPSYNKHNLSLSLLFLILSPLLLLDCRPLLVLIRRLILSRSLTHSHQVLVWWWPTDEAESSSAADTSISHSYNNNTNSILSSSPPPPFNLWSSMTSAAPPHLLIIITSLCPT